jgi:hypothetical protein
MTKEIKALQLEQSALMQRMEKLREEMKNPNIDIAAQATVKLLNLNNKLIDVTESINELLDVLSKETVERVVNQRYNPDELR